MSPVFAALLLPLRLSSARSWFFSNRLSIWAALIFPLPSDVSSDTAKNAVKPEI